MSLTLYVWVCVFAEILILMRTFKSVKSPFQLTCRHLLLFSENSLPVWLQLTAAGTSGASGPRAAASATGRGGGSATHQRQGTGEGCAKGAVRIRRTAQMACAPRVRPLCPPGIFPRHRSAVITSSGPSPFSRTVTCTNGNWASLWPGARRDVLTPVWPHCQDAWIMSWSRDAQLCLISTVITHRQKETS